MDEVIKSIFIFVYVVVAFSCLTLTRLLDNGVYIVWLIIISSWGCDTCAYCVGMLIGKTKLSKILSPKKSVEGAVGGVIGSLIICFVYLMIVNNRMGVDFGYAIKATLVCGFSSIISMFGDLFASGIKRENEIKDYGKLIPGHGGVLDRFDSVIFVAPIIYILFELVM